MNEVSKLGILVNSKAARNPSSNLLNQSLVNPHLVGIPSLTTFTARRFPCRDLQVLGRQSDGSLGAEILGLCALDELGADLLKGLDFPAKKDMQVSLLGYTGDKNFCEERGMSYLLVRVMRILWILGPSPKSFSGFV